ncbi:MAG: lipase maturation factor family protein, partial [Polyangiaceae bacterium]
MEGRTLARRLFAPSWQRRSMLWPRWVALRAIGFFFFSAFFSLGYEILGLVGSHGLRPAALLFETLRAHHGVIRYWEVPSLLWLDCSDHALTALVVLGLVASILLIANVAPKASIAACLVLFLSFVAAASEFSEYQSDGMLLEAAAIGFFLAPKGLRPKLGEAEPPTRAALFLLKWEWFRIYFESGIVKLTSGDASWRDFSAMDHYYENSPLPTWLGWYAQQLPHWFHALTAFWTLTLELVVVWLAFFPRHFRLILFFVVTAFQVGIILTSNYAFLNYLVLAFGVLLLDDDAFRKIRLVRPKLRVTPHSRPKAMLAGFALSWVFLATIGAFLFTDAPVLGWPAQSLA